MVEKMITMSNLNQIILDSENIMAFGYSGSICATLVDQV